MTSGRLNNSRLLKVGVLASLWVNWVLKRDKSNEITGLKELTGKVGCFSLSSSAGELSLRCCGWGTSRRVRLLWRRPLLLAIRSRLLLLLKVWLTLEFASTGGWHS